MTDELHELAALYVIDALTREESIEFESHLAECSTCQQEVAEMREVTLWLSRSEAADPPGSLRTTVLGLIDATPQETALAPAVSGTTRHRSNDAGESVGAEVVPFPARRATRLPYLVAAAGVVVALVFGGWAVQSRQTADQANAQRTEIIKLLGASDVRVATAPGANGGSGTVVVSKQSGRAVFVASQLPDLAAGQVYELWTVTKAAVPAGTFASGADTSVVTLPTAALSAASIAVSVEPTGGSSQPTTPPFMRVTLPTI